MLIQRQKMGVVQSTGSKLSWMPLTLPSSHVHCRNAKGVLEKQRFSNVSVYKNLWGSHENVDAWPHSHILLPYRVLMLLQDSRLHWELHCLKHHRLTA